MYPIEYLGSYNWKITLPVSGAKEIKMPALATYSSAWMQMNAVGDGVTFKAPTDGGTTTNSKNPRSELREMTQDGKTNAAWSTTVGEHSMTVELSVDALPIGSKPHCVIAQIHDSDDDMTVFRVERQPGNLAHLWITDGDKTHGYLVTDSLRIGKRIKVGFYVKAGKIIYTFNGLPVSYAQNKKTLGCYFKTGAYNQSGGNVTRLPDGSSDFAQVTIYALQVCHAGVCVGRAPGDASPPVDPKPAIDLQPVIVALEKVTTDLQASITQLKALKDC